jgi:AraC-like DNA-binding protein
MGSTAAPPVREEWFYETARLSQEILCDVRANGLAPRAIVDLLARLPVPLTAVEAILRQGFKFNVLLNCVDDRSCSLDERTNSVMRRVLEVIARPSALQDAPEWRAADLIRERGAFPLDVPGIARAVGCHQSRLRELFRQAYGMKMREFHRRCRAALALQMFAAGETKIAAIARAVGYRSDKNFYRLLRDLTRQTPEQFRSMSPECLRKLAREILGRQAAGR